MPIERTIENTTFLDMDMRWVRDSISKGLRAGPVLLTLGRPRRSLDQNKKMWPMLNDIATQIKWFDQELNTKQWKDLLTAAYKEQDCVPGINGGVVFFGLETSKLRVDDFSELIELIYAFGAEKNVKWSEKSVDLYREQILRKINKESMGGIPANGFCICGGDIVEQAVKSNKFYITGCDLCNRSFLGG